MVMVEELQALIDEKVRVLHELMAKREEIDVEVDNELNELHELRYKMMEATKCGD